MCGLIAIIDKFNHTIPFVTAPILWAGTRENLAMTSIAQGERGMNRYFTQSRTMRCSSVMVMATTDAPTKAIARDPKIRARYDPV
jgi:hypothetical protein